MCCTFIMYSIIILHSCKGNTHPLPPSIIYVYKECICIDCFIHWTQEIQSIDKWTEAICTLMMKTVLVLTLLAVTIACCYAQPAEREHSQHPGKYIMSDMYNWSYFTELMIFFYILGMKLPEVVGCFHYLGCSSFMGEADNSYHCCKIMHGRSFNEFGRCRNCPF